MTTNKTAPDNNDPMRIYNFVASINNTTITDKIAKQVQNAPKVLQDEFKKVKVLLLYSAARQNSFSSTLQLYHWQGTHPNLGEPSP